MQPMATRERILLAITACAALLVIPMTALAATGQLINIIDPTNAARAAKVTQVGALQVETRPGIPSDLVYRVANRSGTGWVSLYQVSTGRNYAMAEFSAANMSTAGAKSAQLSWFTIPSSLSCTSFSISSATATSTIRTVIVPNQSTVVVSFSGVPINVPPAPSGSKQCLGVVVGGPSTGTIQLGTSGYTWVP